MYDMSDAEYNEYNEKYNKFFGLVEPGEVIYPSTVKELVGFPTVEATYAFLNRKMNTEKHLAERIIQGCPYCGRIFGRLYNSRREIAEKQICPYADCKREIAADGYTVFQVVGID